MGNKLLLWEALKALTENPKLKLKSDAGELKFRDGRLRWTNEDFTIQHGEANKWDTLTCRYFSVIEPPKQLKKMSFGEAFKHLIKSASIKSLKSHILYNSNDEIACFGEGDIDGLWTVEGIFEEVETNG